MKKHNLKWKIYQQRENCQPQLKSVSIESSPRNANYLIRREVTSRNPQQKNNVANYTKYVLHSNPLSPASSPNTTKNLIKFDEKQFINQPTITVIDRKHSLSTLSTENRSIKQRLSPINQKAYTESIKVTTQQFTEQNQSIGKENQEDNINDVYGSRIVMQEKKNKYNWLFDENKKRNLKRKLIQLQVKESKKSSNVMDQVIKIIRTINQPSYRFEASQRQSNNWYENVKFEPGSIKKIFTFSQSQFKIYFSQYFDKHLKLYRIIEINNEILTLINKYHEIEIELKQQRREQFKEPSSCCLSKVQNQICLNQFRFTKEIQTYGMIDIINDNSFLSITVRKYSTENQLDSSSQSDDLDETEFFKQAKKIFSNQLTPQHIDNNPDLTIFDYKISFIISCLDTKTKNKLLSVDYTIIDKKIYFDNINEMFPTFDDEYRNKHFFKVYSNQYDQFYRDLLEGNYQFLNPISDFEYEAPQNILEIKTNLDKLSSSNHDSQGIDKKQMLINMRQQKIWQSGEIKQKNLIRSANFSPRSTVQVPQNFLEINNQFLESPKISVSHISVSQQNVNNNNVTKRKSISKSIHGRNAQSPDLLTRSYAQPDILVNCLDDTSQDSFEIRKITMSKSQEQIPKLNSAEVKKDSRKKLISASQQFKMISSVKSEAIYPDTQSDSQILDKYLDFMTIKNKGASPQSLKLETLLLYQNMLKQTSSKKKKVEILIKHGLLDQFQEFMDLHRNFNLNNYTGNGMPFISLAASNGHEEIVRFMLNFNINLEMLDSNGYPPLYHAMLHSNYNIADILIQNGANPYFKKQI